MVAFSLRRVLIFLVYLLLLMKERASACSPSIPTEALIVVSTTCIPIPQCPDSTWSLYQNSLGKINCYKVIEGPSGSSNGFPNGCIQAESECLALNGAHLVSIHDQGEQNFVFDLASPGTEQTMSMNEFTQQTCIGLIPLTPVDSTPDSGLSTNPANWGWIDGSMNTFNNWLPAPPSMARPAPNNDGGNEACATMYTKAVGTLPTSFLGYWDDLKCSLVSCAIDALQSTCYRYNATLCVNS